MNSIRSVLILLSASLAWFAPIANGQGQDTYEQEMHRFRKKMERIDHADFKEWLLLEDELNGIENGHLHPSITEDCKFVLQQREKLLFGRFSELVETRNADEAAEIFSAFGASIYMERMIDILETCDDLEFIAQLLHAELDPEHWSRLAWETHTRSNACNPAGFHSLYFKALGESLPEGDYSKLPPLGSWDGEACRPFRERLEEKFPMLKHHKRKRFAETPPPRRVPEPSGTVPKTPPIGNAASPSSDDAPPKGKTQHLPALAAAGAFLLLAFLSWRILRNRRSGRK